MRTLTTQEATSWCREHRIEIDQSGNPYFDSDGANGIRLLLPKEPHRLPYMILSLLDVEVNELDELSGVEHLLWLRSWEMWPELATSIGLEQFETLRRGLGIIEGTSEKPAILFSGTEIKSLISCALVPLVFGWDCYIVPSSAEYFAFMCHDQWVGISAKNEATESRLINELQRWSPEVNRPSGAHR